MKKQEELETVILIKKLRKMIIILRIVFILYLSSIIVFALGIIYCLKSNNYLVIFINLLFIANSIGGCFKTHEELTEIETDRALNRSVRTE